MSNNMHNLLVSCNPTIRESPNKKRKHIDYNNNPSTKSPPQKRAKISKRPSKKPNRLLHSTTPNSHVTITFANLHNTIDAIILSKENVLLISEDILLSNKGKLSIKKSDIIQNDITPQISLPNNCINKLETINKSISTIHSRNSFRIGCALFYCSDEQRLFWAFPLRKTRRVSCQHYCCAANNKIVTRSVGIYSNKCNGKHNKTIKCVYAIANGKPPKGTINQNLMTNYQYFIHSINTKLLIPCTPADIISAGPPPLESNNSKGNFTNISNNIPKAKMELTLTEEPIPFQQNVQINLKALVETNRNNKLKQNISSITSSSSIASEPEAHDYTQLLLHSTSSCVRDIEKYENKNENKKEINYKNEIENNEFENEMESDNEIYDKCQQLLILNKFNEVIKILKPLIPINNSASDVNINKYRLLMAISLYYSSSSESSLHFCNLILSNGNNSNSNEWYEAKKLRGLIHKELRNYKAACHDFEFVCFNNPINKTWKDKLYLINKNKSISNSNSNNISIKAQPQPQPQPQQSINYSTYINSINPMNGLPLNQILTTHSNVNYYRKPSLNINNINTLNLNLLPQLPQMHATAPNLNIKQPVDIANPNAPIVFIPPFMDRNANKNNNNNSNSNNNNNNNNLGQLLSESKGFMDKQISNLSFEDMITDLKRKTTREELLDESNNNFDDKSVSGTPEPLKRIRSDAI